MSSLYKFTNLLLFVLAFIPVNGQISKVIIVDSKTKEVLPFSLLHTRHDAKNRVITADDKGMTSINIFDRNDTIIISHIGYQSLHIPVNKTQDSIFLERKLNVLKEVNIGVSSHDKNANNFKRKGIIKYIPSIGIERAAKIKFRQSDSGNLKMIRMVKIKMKLDPDNSSYRLRMYDANAHGMPGNELLISPILINSKDIKGTVATMDISEMNVYTHAEAVFISIELIKKNANDLNDHKSNTNKNIIYDTDYYSDASLYLRTATYRNWTLLDKPVNNSGNPVNMMVSVIYQ